MKLRWILFFLLISWTQVFVDKGEANLETSTETLESIAFLASKSMSSSDAKELFDKNSKLQAHFSFITGASDESWELIPKGELSSRVLCQALKLEDCYLVSGDVRQSQFAVVVKTGDFNSEDSRISTERPKIGIWILKAIGKRPDGDLPQLSSGASPAYDLKTYDTQISLISFNKN